MVRHYAVGALSAAVIPGGDIAKLDQKHFRVSELRYGMGTYVNMIVVHPSKIHAQDCIGRTFDDINRLIAIMNRFDHSSYVAHLNSAGVLKGMPIELREVLRAALYYSRVTGGAFDITVQPLVDLYAQHFRTNNCPPPLQALEEAMETVGSQHLKLTEDQVCFQRNGMGVTLDGIAKGYILDRAMISLRANGIRHALVNAGGDILAYGGKGFGDPWKIVVQDPWIPGRHTETLSVCSGAVATSGSYEVYFDRQKLFHHLISPHSGAPAQRFASVTIVAPTAIQADALATATFVMDPVHAWQVLSSFPGVAALGLTRARQALKSPGWEECRRQCSPHPQQAS